jgi:rhodanese-related sulfurtransferase
MQPEIPTTTVQDLPDPLPDDLTVLDVREPEEWSWGHIEGAVHVPLMQLPERREEVPDGRVLVVCKIGGRSRQATGYLLQQGFDVVNLDGGMVDWAEAGRPMLSEKGRPPQVV